MKIVHFKDWREHRGMTQKEAALELGMSRAHLSRMESTKRGQRRRYNEDFMTVCAQLYQCTVEELYINPNDPQLRLRRACAGVPPSKVDGAIRALEKYLKKKLL